MFGYIRPVNGELLVKDSELYSSVYCGLCIYGGKHISRLTRLLLNYDFVLLALLRISLTGESVSIETKRCPYKLKKKKCLRADDTYKYVCSAFGILTYGKLLDDIHDEKGIKRFFKKLSKPFFTHIKNRSLNFDGLYEIIESGLKKISETEKENCTSLDRASDGFAEMMGKVASYGITDSKQRIAYTCGYHIGRYIYIIDALDDLDEDLKSGNYNPLLASYGSIEAAEKEIPSIAETLYDSLNAFSNSYALCCSPKQNGIDRLVFNISELGGRNAVNRIIERKSKK